MNNTKKQPQNLNTGKSSGFGTGTTNAGTGRPGMPNTGKTTPTTAQPQKTQQTGKQAWNQNQGKPGMGKTDDDRNKGGQSHR